MKTNQEITEAIKVGAKTISGRNRKGEIIELVSRQFCDGVALVGVNIRLEDGEISPRGFGEFEVLIGETYIPTRARGFDTRYKMWRENVEEVAKKHEIPAKGLISLLSDNGPGDWREIFKWVGFNDYVDEFKAQEENK